MINLIKLFPDHIISPGYQIINGSYFRIRKLTNSVPHQQLLKDQAPEVPNQPPCLWQGLSLMLINQDATLKNPMVMHISCS